MAKPRRWWLSLAGTPEAARAGAVPASAWEVAIAVILIIVGTGAVTIGSVLAWSGASYVTTYSWVFGVIALVAIAVLALGKALLDRSPRQLFRLYAVVFAMLLAVIPLAGLR